MKGGRLSSLRRILLLSQRVQKMRYAPALRELAAEFGVVERTIRRDFELLESAGIKVPIWRQHEQLAEIRGRR
jgi:predicted DNA-binding transcriptional regulator YafY